MGYSRTTRIASYKILCDKALEIANHSKYDVYQRQLALTVYTFFHKKSSTREM